MESSKIIIWKKFSYEKITPAEWEKIIRTDQENYQKLQYSTIESIILDLLECKRLCDESHF